MSSVRYGAGLSRATKVRAAQSRAAARPKRGRIGDTRTFRSGSSF